jgi:hypothetical protein
VLVECRRDLDYAEEKRLKILMRPVVQPTAEKKKKQTEEEKPKE